MPNFVPRAQLYRHYDFGGALLYVGISLSVLARLEGHKRKSLWFDRIAFITVEHYASREEAEQAETLAIRRDQPIYNIKKKAIPYDEFIGPDDMRPGPDETWEEDRLRTRKGARK